MTVAISRTEFEQFRSTIAARLGLQFDESKTEWLLDVIRNRMASCGAATCSAYLTGLARANEREEFRVLASQLTVGETYFFRSTEQVQALTETILPDWLRSGNGRQRLRVLSAGCASGEEAYSIAILLREHCPSICQSGVHIVGMDINPLMIKKARDARYSDWSLRSTPKEIAEKYFRKTGVGFTLHDDIRAMVAFEERNLAEADDSGWKMEQFDIIFFRNSLMYMTGGGAQLVVARLTSVLRPEGFLFLGHAETLRGISQNYHLCHTQEAFYYQKRASAGVETIPSAHFEPVPTTAGTDLSWVDAVRRASEHIESLSRVSAGHVSSAPPSARRFVVAKPGSMGGSASSRVALDLLRREKFQEALDVLRSDSSDGNCDLDAEVLRAVLLTNIGDIDGAETVCEQVLSADELNAEAHYLTAICREHTHDLQSAMEHDRKAIYIDHEFAMPHLHLGLLAKRVGDIELARRELEEANGLFPREEPSRILLLGSGFSREALVEFSRAQRQACGGNLEHSNPA